MVAKGFQDQDSELIRSDSPTCSKESLRVVLAIIASQGWSCNSMDIKTAFLQGKQFERTVYLVPPPEAKVTKDYIWKLNKCVYGLNDASREWYLTVREELIKLRVYPSKYDQAVFTYYCDGKLNGIISTHVDDFCWAGTRYFENEVINNLRKIFIVKSEEDSSFRYLGLDIIQKKDSILVKQDEFVKSVNLIPSKTNYNSTSELSDEELKLCRSTIGKLNWLATQTRPDLSYEVSDLTSSLKDKKVDSISQINKTARKAKKIASKLLIPNIGSFANMKLVGYCDASFAALPNGGSQCGYVIFLLGDNGEYVPISWQSQKIKRVVKSTHAAETLAMVDTMEACAYYRQYIIELLRVDDKPDNVPIVCKTDNTAVYDSAYSSTQIPDKRLRIETAIIREMLEQKIVHKLEWIPTAVQIADGLTKRGVSSCKVLDHICEPRMPLP